MKSLSIFNRFILSTVVFLLPMTAMIYSLYIFANDQVLFSAKEKQGQLVLDQILPIENKLLASHFNVLKNGQDLTEAEKQSLTNDWEEILDIASTHKNDRDHLESGLKNYLSAPIADKQKGAAFIDLHSSLLKLKKEIAGSLNLVLDPDLDSYYLMSSVVDDLPNIQEKYVKFAGEIHEGHAAPALMIYEHLFTNLEAHLAETKNADSANYGEITSFQSNYTAYQDDIRLQKEVVQALFKSLDKSIADKKATIDAVAELSKANGEITLKLNQELGKFIDKRLVVLKGNRDKMIIVILGAFVVAVVLSGYLGYSISKTIKTFKTVVGKLRNDAKIALDIGQSLIQTSTKVSQASSNQAAAIEQTSASLEELSSMVAINAANSQKAREMASEAKNHASQGSVEMKSLIVSMNEISESSKKIEAIMKIIDDIAFQTNLLALNASVEAARAGEHGKSFAVVADAVRALAQKSAESAKEIGTLISDSLQKIENGKASVDRSGVSMNAILSSIENVNSLNGEIAHSSQEQTAGIQQIAQAVSELEKATIDNSSEAQQSSEYSNQSLGQAEGLMRIVDILDSELNGNHPGQMTVVQADFNFQDAIQAHLKWKGRLKNYVEGISQEKLDHAIVCKDNQCLLGKWIYGIGLAHEKLPTFAVLKKEHAAFHEAAGAIVKAVQNNESRAISMLAEGSEFDRRTRSTVAALQELDRQFR